MFELTDGKKIGLGLTGFGVFFTFIGIMLFFDAGLLAIGNIMFLSGVTLLLGPKRMANFFFPPDNVFGKARGSLCFLGGVIMVFSGWVKVGVLVELFGFANLFGDFFPVAVSFARRLPFVGNLLGLPLVSQIVDRISGATKLPLYDTNEQK